MTRWKSLGGSVVLAALVASTTAARADLTAAQVWQDWQSYASSFGQQITVGAKEETKGQLKLRDMTILMEQPDGTVVKGVIPEVLMKENRGKVDIALSPEYTFHVRTEVIPPAPLEDEESTEDSDQEAPLEPVVSEIDLIVRHPDLVLTASGSPESITYDMAGPALTVTLDNFTTDGEPMEQPLDVEVALNAFQGKYVLSGTGTRNLVSEMTSESVTFAMSGSNPETGETVEMTGNMADLKAASSGTLPQSTPGATLAQMMEKGFTSKGSVSYGKVSYAFALTQEDQATSLAGETARGDVTFEIGGMNLSYAGKAENSVLRVSGDAIPLPEVVLSVAQSVYALSMPVGTTAKPQDFSLVTKIVDLTMNDEVWNLFDAGKVLSRAPATLIFDLSGKARWLVDIFDPAIAEQPMEGMPGEVDRLDINALQLKLAGADLTGTGAFTFDNSMAAQGGMPMPAGHVDLKLVGGNALIDNLVRLGFVPEDQAMFARMMLGMIARPGDGPDTLVSKIELTKDGQILANGQRLQ